MHKKMLGYQFGFFDVLFHRKDISTEFNGKDREIALLRQQLDEKDQLIADKDVHVNEINRFHKIRERLTAIELNASIQVATSIVSNMTDFGLKVKEGIVGLEEIQRENQDMVAAIEQIAKSAENLKEITAGQKASYDSMIAVEEAIRSGSKRSYEQLKNLVNEINKLKKTKEFLSQTGVAMSDIASRLALLGMNAAIEAAHAGLQGKGFAVVADEMRKLAEGTSGLLKEQEVKIKEIITIVETAVRDGQNIEKIIGDQAQAIENASTSLAALQELNNRVSQVAEELASAVEQEMAGMTEVAAQIAELLKNQKSLENYINHGEIFYSDKYLKGVALFKKIGVAEATFKAAIEKVLIGYSQMSVTYSDRDKAMVAYAKNADALFFDPSNSQPQLIHVARMRDEKNGLSKATVVPTQDANEYLFKIGLQSIGVTYDDVRNGKYADDDGISHSRLHVIEEIDEKMPTAVRTMAEKLKAPSIFILTGMLPGGAVYCLPFYSTITRTQANGDKVDPYVKTLSIVLWEFYLQKKFGW